MAELNWNRRTWRLAAPVMLSNVSVPLLGAVDTAVVGHLPGPEYLGAVAIGALIFNAVYHGCNFLRMGTTGLTAQSFGAGDGAEVRAWLARAAILAVAMGMLLIALQWPIIAGGLAIIDPSSDVSPLTRSYFDFRIWGAPAALMNYALLGWFFGIQRPLAALATQIFMNGLNIGLDFWFVWGLDMGVDGVAIATVIAEYAAAGLGFAIAAAQLRRLGGHWDWARVRLALPLKRMVSVNRDIFIRSMCLQTTFVLITAAGARLGDVTLAANAVLLNFQQFSAHALDGFANAAEALAGAAVGAKRRDHFRAAVRATTNWACVFALGFTAFYFALGGVLIDLLTGVDAVRAAARDYLPWAVGLPLLSVWSFQLDGIFIGSTWAREMRNAMLISLALFAAGLAAFLPVLDNHGLWLAFALFMLARAVTLAAVLPRLERRIGTGS